MEASTGLAVPIVASKATIPLSQAWKRIPETVEHMVASSCNDSLVEIMAARYPDRNRSWRLRDLDVMPGIVHGLRRCELAMETIGLFDNGLRQFGTIW